MTALVSVRLVQSSCVCMVHMQMKTRQPSGLGNGARAHGAEVQDARAQDVQAHGTLGQYDLVVIGAGILGLGHAWHALNLGLRVAIVERDEEAVGASIRNFGHVCVSAQSGIARDYADIARNEWLRLAPLAGIEVREVGTLIVARSEHEEAVLSEFSATRADEARLLGGAETAAVLGMDHTESAHIRSGAHLPLDLRVDPLVAVQRIAAHLASEGVDFFFGTNAGHIEPGRVRTSRGMLYAPHIVVTVGHNVDRFFPDLADTYAVERCRLRMFEIDTPRGATIEPALFTGLSLLRYDAFRELPASAALRDDFAAEHSELLEHDLNHMMTQRPNGALIVGDTHHRSRTATPFENERSDELLLAETARLFGTQGLRIRRRWRGVYASSNQTNFLNETPLPGVRVASVTTGIGMTTALGFARDSLETLLNEAPESHTTPTPTPIHNTIDMRKA